MSTYARVQRLLMRCLAHFVLESRTRRCSLSSRGETSIKADRDRLAALYAEAFDICNASNACKECVDSRCCSGKFGRITVVDSIVHTNTKAQGYEWSYALYPFGSYEKNRCDMGWCDFFREGKGCALVSEEKTVLVY